MKTTTRQTLEFYWKHLKVFPALNLTMILAVLTAVIAGMVWPFMLRWFIDTLTLEGNVDVIADQLFHILFIMISIEFIGAIGWRSLHYAIVAIQSRVMKNMMDDCFEQLHRHSYKFFTDRFVGSLVKKSGRLVRAFEALHDSLFYEMIPVILRVSIVNVALLYVSPKLGIPLLIWTTIFITYSYFLSLYKLRKYDKKAVEADTKVTASFADTITNNTNIKLFSALRMEQKNFKEVTQNWQNRFSKSWNFNAHIELVQSLLMLVIIFLVFYRSIFLWKEGGLTVGDFVLIQGYLIELLRVLWDFGRNIRRMYERFADAAEMIDILNTPLGIVDIPRAKSLSITRGKIEFKHVTFGYNKEKGVLDNLSFKVNPSEKIALIGPSGGGKSTLTKLLLRLFDVNKGKILVDGVDIANVTQESLRRQISLVPQDPILFHRSLFENIRYGRRDASQEEVIAAAKLAHCHEFIQAFPDQYDTLVGERGVKLSGGERQRIAIARAILSNTKILILDEATSNLDSESERLIQDALKNLMKNKTTLVIAHRLSTIVSMDRILVLDGGKIVEEGSHKTLSKKPNSLYQKLWNLQVGGYLT